MRPNDVLTTCKAIIKIIARRYVADHLHNQSRSQGLLAFWLAGQLTHYVKNMAVQDWTVSLYYIFNWQFAMLLILCHISDIVGGFLFLLNHMQLMAEKSLQKVELWSRVLLQT